MNDRKVLIVTYYWPPSGGSGVQRWLKFVKYLPQFGWTPYVYTPENPSFEIRDESLLKDIPPEAEVIKLPIWEPYTVFSKLSGIFSGNKVRSADFISTGKKSLFNTIATFIRGNFFIPDPKIFWVRPSVKFLHDFIRDQRIKTIITTGPPHSMHLIGLKLKKRDPQLKWITDFRDPWSEWDLLDTLSLSLWARHRHRDLERQVLRQADQVITIAPYHQDRLTELSGRKVQLITNGFDEDDFKDVAHERTKFFTIRHIGVVDELRDPRPVMEALRELLLGDLDMATQIRVEFIGNVNSRFIEYVTSDPLLGSITVFAPAVPHDQLMLKYGSTDLLLLVLAHTAIAPGNLPGKFFEYLASGNLILAIGSVEGDSARILHQLRAGEIFERSNIEGIKAFVLKAFDAWRLGNSVKRTIKGSSFTRSNLTKRLAELLG